MSNASVKSIWYGILKTSKASTVVLRDDGLPEPLSGRIYLYNSDRDKIIEYVDKIVSTKLKELTADEIRALGKDVEKKYKAARKLFLSENKSSGKVLDLRPDEMVAKAVKEKATSEIVEETAELAEDIDEIDEDIDWEDDEEISA